MIQLLIGLLLILAISPSPAAGLEIADFGGLPDGGDVTPAFNAAVSAAAVGPDKTIHFWAGEYCFKTQPSPLHSAVRLVGEGWYSTKLVRCYSNGLFISGSGTGLYIKDVALWASPGTVGGTALYLWADNKIGPGGKHVIENVRVLEGTVDCASTAAPLLGHTAAGCPFGFFAMGISLDGTNRTLAPEGIRAVTMRNVLVWSATWRAVQWWNCRACEWYGGGAYQGAGTSQEVVIGGPLSAVNRIDAQIGGPLYVSPGSLRPH